MPMIRTIAFALLIIGLGVLFYRQETRIRAIEQRLRIPPPASSAPGAWMLDPTPRTLLDRPGSSQAANAPAEKGPLSRLRELFTSKPQISTAPASTHSPTKGNSWMWDKNRPNAPLEKPASK